MTSLEDGFYNFTVWDDKGNEIFKAKVKDAPEGPIFVERLQHLGFYRVLRWLGLAR